MIYTTTDLLWELMNINENIDNTYKKIRVMVGHHERYITKVMIDPKNETIVLYTEADCDIEYI